MSRNRIERNKSTYNATRLKDTLDGRNVGKQSGQSEGDGNRYQDEKISCRFVKERILLKDRQTSGTTGQQGTELHQYDCKK
jgi:hypothetical protein